MLNPFYYKWLHLITTLATPNNSVNSLSLIAKFRMHFFIVHFVSWFGVEPCIWLSTKHWFTKIWVSSAFCISKDVVRWKSNLLLQICRRKIAASARFDTVSCIQRRALCFMVCTAYKVVLRLSEMYDYSSFSTEKHYHHSSFAILEFSTILFLLRIYEPSG